MRTCAARASLCSCSANCLVFSPKCDSNRPVCRVSSAATRSTSASVWRARGDRSSRFPIGVATTNSVPLIARSIPALIKSARTMNFQRHPARQLNRKASTVAVLLLSLIVGACETPGGGALGGSAESRAERAALNGEYQEAAGIYIGLAADASGAERDRLTLLAVD